MGIWKNIIAVEDIKQAEWVVIIDDINPNFRSNILKFNKEKVICIPREPMRRNPEYLKYGFKYDFTYSNFFH